MEILGIDLGNYATKTSEKILFESRVATGHHGINKNDIKVEYNGKRYTVGSKAGVQNLGKRKIYDYKYDICLLTAIVKSFPKMDNIECKIVVGLPPEEYDSPLKEELKQRLNTKGIEEIIICEGDKRTSKKINIVEADVFEESAVVFRLPKQYRDKKTLWIDIGGGTADISQFDGLTLVKHTTTKLGMLTLFKNMKTSLNSVGGKGLNTEDMEDMLNKDMYILDGVKTDISFLKDCIVEHVAKLNNEITQNFEASNREINVIGGGAPGLIEEIKNYYHNAKVLEENQFLNALTNKAVGEMLWGGK